MPKQSFPDKKLLDLMRVTYPSTIAKNLVSVQPIAKPEGRIFYNRTVDLKMLKRSRRVDILIKIVLKILLNFRT